jgi:hypothetical protein
MSRYDESGPVLGRLGLLTGAAWVVCILVGNSLTESGAPEGDGPAESLAYFALLRGGSHQVGLALELFGFCLMAVYVARLYAALRDAEGPASWLPGAALTGGLLTLAIKLGSAAFLVVGLTVTDLPGEQAALLLQLGDAAFLVSAMTSGILTLGVAASALVSGLLPRWLAALGLPIGALAVLGSLAPSSLDGTPGVPGFLLGLLWLGAISVLLAVRSGRSVGSHDRVLAEA